MIPIFSSINFSPIEQDKDSTQNHILFISSWRKESKRSSRPLKFAFSVQPQKCVYWIIPIYKYTYLNMMFDHYIPIRQSKWIYIDL